MRKSHNVVGNEEINLNYFNRLKKTKSKKSINLTTINEKEENAIGQSRTFVNNVPNNYSMLNQNKTSVENESLERKKSENRIVDRVFRRRMDSKKIKINYNNDIDNIKEIKKDNKENKENKEKELEMNEKLQRFNLFIYDAINNMVDKNGRSFDDDKKMKSFLNIKLVNGFINKVNSLKSDDKNNGKINFEQFIESGFLQNEGIILCDKIEVEKKPNKIDILMKLMEDYRDRVLESCLCKNFQDRIILNIYISLSQKSFKLYNEIDNNKEIYLRRYLCNLANNIKFNSPENPNRTLYSINQKLIDVYDKKANIKNERNEYRNFDDEDEDYIYEKLDEFDSSEEENISNKNEKEDEEEYFNIDKMNINYGLEYSNETFENDDFSYIRDVDIEDKIKRSSTMEKNKKNEDKNSSNINQNVKKKLNFQIIDFNSINLSQKKNKNNDNEDVYEIDLNSGGKSTLVFKEEFDKSNELREKKYHFNIQPDENTNKKNRAIQELSFIAYNNIINIITKNSKFLPKYEYHLEPGEIMKYIEEKEKQYMEINDDEENKIKLYRENNRIIKFNENNENRIKIPIDNKFKYKKSKSQKIKIDTDSNDSNSGFDSLKSGTQNSSLSMNKNKNSTKILNFDIDDE
jgi:hypothetical protein